MCLIEPRNKAINYYIRCLRKARERYTCQLTSFAAGIEGRRGQAIDRPSGGPCRPIGNLELLTDAQLRVASASKDVLVTGRKGRCSPAAARAKDRERQSGNRGFTVENVTRVGGLVNRGTPARTPLHLPDRQQAFNGIWDALDDR